ncbi:MAG TPA: hypothetical protein VM534_08020 [Thermoanaerobaculia bacterium]|nr:hypothetical protein [Thermoanaerobaculia bacterium]
MLAKMYHRRWTVPSWGSPGAWWLGAEEFVANLRLFEHDVPVLTLEGLRKAKRAAGRIKDLADLAEIEQIERLTEARDRPPRSND